MGTPTWRVVVIGGAMGLLAVAVAVVLIVTGVTPGGMGGSPAPGGPVLVVLVAPDASGVVVPRVIDVYTPLGAVTVLRSVDPSMPATVAGTSAETLAEAYPYGGGGAVAAAYGRAAGVATPAWVVVDPDTWMSVVTSDSIHVDVPADMQVFDGAGLYSFTAGPSAVPVAETTQLFDGVSYLTPQQQASVRVQIGDMLASALASATPTQASGLRSAFEPAGLQVWLKSIGTPRRSAVQ